MGEIIHKRIPLNEKTPSTEKLQDHDYKNVTSYKNELSLVQCKKILNQNGNNYSDEDVLLIRDWLSHYADIVIETLNQKINNR